MPLYSEHISNMYFGGSSSYSGLPYSYGSSVSPLGSSYSASYLNPGGTYSNHSSLAGYSRTPLSSRWISSSGRNYSPMLSTISERGTASPIRINSPRRLPLSKRTYGTPTYTPRPININTADIDVSKDRYRRLSETTPTVSPKTSPKVVPKSEEVYKDNVEKETGPFMPRVDGKPETGIDSSPGHQRSTIKRGRTVVRLHTIKRRERDSPRKPAEDSGDQNANSDVSPDAEPKNESVPDTQEDAENLSWREKLSDDLIYKGKKEKKSLGTKLVEKFLIKNDDENEEAVPTQTTDLKNEAELALPPSPVPSASRSPDRRCSMELLAEQASLFDSLIRRENLSTTGIDLSKIGVSDNSTDIAENFQPMKKRRGNEADNPLKTTKSDHSLHKSLKSSHDQKDFRQLSKRRSLKKSASGGSIRRLDSITEFTKEITLSNLPSIEESRLSVKKENTKPKPKLKAVITSSVEVSPPRSPLKFKVENVTVEEIPCTPKKEIVYSSVIEDPPPQMEATSSTPQRNNKNRRSIKIKNKNTSSDEVISPEPDDGNFWDKIGKRETVYLMKRKQNIDDAREKHRRALFWYPEDDESSANEDAQINEEKDLSQGKQHGSLLTCDIIGLENSQNNENISVTIEDIKNMPQSTSNDSTQVICVDLKKLATEKETVQPSAIESDPTVYDKLVSNLKQIEPELNRLNKSDDLLIDNSSDMEKVGNATDKTPFINKKEEIKAHNADVDPIDKPNAESKSNTNNPPKKDSGNINNKSVFKNIQKLKDIPKGIPKVSSSPALEEKPKPKELLKKSNSIEHKSPTKQVTEKDLPKCLQSVEGNGTLPQNNKVAAAVKIADVNTNEIKKIPKNLNISEDNPTPQKLEKEEDSLKKKTGTGPEPRSNVKEKPLAKPEPKSPLPKLEKQQDSSLKKKTESGTEPSSNIKEKPSEKAEPKSPISKLAKEEESSLKKKTGYAPEPGSNVTVKPLEKAEPKSPPSKPAKQEESSLKKKTESGSDPSSNIAIEVVQDSTVQKDDANKLQMLVSKVVPVLENIPNKEIVIETEISAHQEESGEDNKAENIPIIQEPQVEDAKPEAQGVNKLPLAVSPKKPVKEEPALRPLIATPRPLQKKTPQVIHSSSSSESSSEESSDEDDDADESDSSEDSNEFYECENNPDGRTSTGSNDSGFDSSAPTSPAGFAQIKKECDVNCHRKCEKLTANLCGVNQRLLVEALAARPSFRKGGDSPGTSGAAQTQADIAEKELEQSTAYGIFRKTGRFTPPARSIPRFRKYAIDDFTFIKVLGKGSFGKVLLAELRDTEYYYAVKCLKKDVVLEDDDVECTLIERKVLALGTNHPYLCHLFATFQTDSHLFFVMEYLNGGDLMFHIQQSGRFPESRARFYAAEIVSGLKFLHKRGIVYRDLKLDNILLDFDGHVRIADFGMCKLQIYLEKTADTFCGTPDYMAPEIIKGLKYNQTVDWWSFGVLLYEMLIGQSPFSGCDEDELFWSICNEMPSYPRFLSQDSLTVLTRLLDKDARTRLGGTECMHGDIRDQEFFRQIHWDRLERRELEAPFKPKVRHPLDTQYFDRAFTGERPRLTAVEPHVLRSMDQEPFRGFSYTNPNATDR